MSEDENSQHGEPRSPRGGSFASALSVALIPIGLMVGFVVLLALFPSEMGTHTSRMSTLVVFRPWIVLGIVSLAVSIGADLCLMNRYGPKSCWYIHLVTIGFGGYMLFGLAAIWLDRLGRW